MSLADHPALSRGDSPKMAWAGGAGAWLSAQLRAEPERWVLWLPVAFAAGIGAYFALDREPSAWPAPVVAAASLALALLWRRRGLAMLLCAGLCAASLGLADAQWQTARTAAPVLAEKVGPVRVVGRLLDVDIRTDGTRLLIAPLPIAGVAATPDKVRVKLRDRAAALEPGDWVQVRATLLPPPGPAYPGGYDFQREAYFQRLGGVGFALGQAQRVEPPDGQAGRPGWRVTLDALRARVTARIRAVLPGTEGGIAAALVTGKRGEIDPAVAQDFRDSGLSHLLVVAGLHMSLVAAFVFFAVRLGIALVPYMALRVNAKKIAAGAALLTLVGYLALSGASVPSQRAFVMNGAVLLAVLFDRARLSMRVAALAASLVLIRDPVALVGTSFQMSFAAVVALVAFYEAWGRRLGTALGGEGLGRQGLRVAAGAVVTTLVATFGTDLISAYHFSRIALYSPLANVIAVPLATVWTMPMACLSVLLMPFGLEALALVPMGWAIQLTEWVAHLTAGLPGDVVMLPRMPGWGLAAAGLGLSWLCIWQRGWRWLGLPGIAVSLLSLATTRPPDLLLAENGRLLGALGGDGVYRVTRPSLDRMAQESWSRLALADDTRPFPKPGQTEGRLACTAEACTYRAEGRLVLLVRKPAGFASFCAGADAVVSLVPVPEGCRPAGPVLQPGDTARDGTTALWVRAEGIVLESTASARGTRPWVRRVAEVEP